jgi:hypothetical protein
VVTVFNQAAGILIQLIYAVPILINVCGIQHTYNVMKRAAGIIIIKQVV